MNISALDLNLLVVLDALLAERSVTRAAGRVGLSQPATSHALARLRDVFGDPLLVRTPRGMQPTARAVEIAPLLRDALEAVRRTLRPTAAFVPRESERTFNVLMADQGSFLILPELLNQLSREAPRMSVAIQAVPFADVAASLADGKLDLAVGLFSEPRPGLHQQKLLHERFVCVVKKGSRASRGALTLDRYCELTHVLVTPSGQPGGVVDDRLKALGRERRVALRVPQFLVVPHVVATTELAWTAPERIARTYAKSLPLAIRPVPLELEGFTVAQVWHERAESEPAHRWFRERVARAVRAHGSLAS